MIHTRVLVELLLGACISVVRGDLLGFASAKGEECLRRVNGTVGAKPECIGAPDQQTVSCPVKDSSARTVHVGLPMSIDFNNTSGDEVSLYWVSDVGAEILQKTIPPWRLIKQDTFMGHVFRVKSKSGRTLLEHTVGMIPLHDDVRLDATDANKADPRSHSDKKAAKLEVGFVNRANSTLKLFFYSAAGKLELITQMEPHTVYPQFTYKGHEFRVYSSDDRLVASVHIQDIVVPNCNEPVRLDPTAHEISGQPQVDAVVKVTECADCTDKPTRARRLKIRDYQEPVPPAGAVGPTVLKARKLKLSKRNEL